MVGGLDLWLVGIMIMKAERGGKKNIHVQLRDKLYHSNLYRQFHLIRHMNRELEVPLSCFLSWCQLPSPLTKQELLPILKQVGFLRIVSKRTWRGEQQYVKFEYEEASRMVLVTGWHKETLQDIVNDFNQGSRREYHYPTIHRNLPSAKVATYNGFWTTIETNSEQTASVLKKHLRSKKRNLDEAQIKNYKVEKRRIRIVVLKQDLFTLLVDAMTEIKSQLFMNSLQIGTQRRNRTLQGLQIVQKLKSQGIVYHPLLLKYYQDPSCKGEWKEEELSDGLNSESNSLNSEILESNRLQQCIETSEQGIQAAQTQAQEGIRSHTCLSQSSPSHSQSPLLEALESNKTEQTSEAEEKKEIELPLEVEQQQQTSTQQCNGRQALNTSPKLQTSLNEIQQSTRHQQRPLMAQKVPILTNAAAQTRQGLYTSVSYALMRRYMREFKQIGSKTLVELPEWVRNESEQERKKHRFFQSLCRPSILQRSRALP